MYQTNMYEGLLAETVIMQGHNGDLIHAYMARPLGSGPYPGMVLLHHAPGWDEWYGRPHAGLRTTATSPSPPICTDRDGHGTPEDVAAKVRAAGGVPDAQVIGDAEGLDVYRCPAKQHRQGGHLRHLLRRSPDDYLAACSTTGFDAAIDCWGGRVVMATEELDRQATAAPIDLTADLSSPLLGLFGNDDQAPTAAQVNQHEEELKKHGKTYEFHRYDGAGHGFFYYDRPAYRQEQAVDGWKKIWAFLEKYLGGPK